MLIIRNTPVFLVKDVCLLYATTNGDEYGMAAYIGSIGEYMEGKEEWSQYAERLDQFLSAIGIADKKKKDVFLAVIGPQTYS